MFKEVHRCVKYHYSLSSLFIITLFISTCQSDFYACIQSGNIYGVRDTCNGVVCVPSHAPSRCCNLVATFFNDDNKAHSDSDSSGEGRQLTYKQEHVSQQLLQLQNTVCKVLIHSGSMTGRRRLRGRMSCIACK